MLDDLQKAEAWNKIQHARCPEEARRAIAKPRPTRTIPMAKSVKTGMLGQLMSFKIQ
jgi:hypothetical protein